MPFSVAIVDLVDPDRRVRAEKSIRKSWFLAQALLTTVAGVAGIGALIDGWEGALIGAGIGVLATGVTYRSILRDNS